MAKKIKGVTCIKRKGTTYWYARVDGRRVCCGKGDKGYKVAVAARSKSIAKQYEKREIAAGLKVKKVHFKTVTDLSNWYMQLPSIQKQKGFGRKISACVHLLAYFGKRLVSHVEADDQERYRERRKEQGAAENTIDTEIRLLSAMYNLARKRKKIHAESMPGQFVFAHENNPRRTITDEEFETLIKHADEDFRDVLICGYESAQCEAEKSPI